MSKKKILDNVLELNTLDLDIDDYTEGEVEYIIEFLETIYKNYNNINNTKFDNLNIESIETIDVSEQKNGKADS